MVRDKMMTQYGNITELERSGSASCPGRRVLLAWEMGEGLGHAERLLRLAVRLRAEGWVPVVAARNPCALAERYTAAGIPVIPAPKHHCCYRGKSPFRASSFADIMGICGYADQQRLAETVAAWDRLFLEQAPDVVIADYSPLLSLAAFGRFPLISVGDGFVTPHGLPGGHFPVLGNEVGRIWEPRTLLQAAQNVQADRALPKPVSLPQIMEGAGQVVAVPWELDIYGATRPIRAAGPWNRPAPITTPPSEPYFFAYLRMDHPLARQIMRVLADHRIPGECYLPHAEKPIVDAVKQAGIILHERPPLLEDVLKHASILLHHGGIGSSEVAVLAGRPQLLLPRHLEQHLNTQRMIDCLSGTVTVRADIAYSRLKPGLLRVINDLKLMKAAQNTAERLFASHETAWDVLQRMLAQVASNYERGRRMR